MCTRRILLYIICLVLNHCKSAWTQSVNITENTIFVRNNAIGQATCILNGYCGNINWFISSQTAAIASAFTDGSFCSNTTVMVQQGYYQTCDFKNQRYKLHLTGESNLHGITIKCIGESCSPQPIVEDIALISIIIQVSSVSLVGISGQQITVTAGQSDSIKCVSGTSRPAPHILWYIGLSNVTSSSTESIHNTTSQMYYTRSTLIFTPTKSQNGLHLNCKAYNTDNNMVELTTKPTLNVQYPPDNTAAVIVGHEDIVLVTENRKFILRCQVRGGNPLATVTWNCFGLIGASSTVGDVSISTITFTVNRTHNGRSCTCKATHPVVTLGDDSITFNVLYEANVISITISGGNFTIPEHSTPVITCLTDGNPPPSITLRFAANNTEIANVDSGLKLEYMIPYARCGDTGIYQCKINVKNAANQQKGEKLNVICPPKSTVSSNIAAFRSLKDKINITVNFIANPIPAITWYFRQNVGIEIQIMDDIETRSSAGMIYTTTLNIQLLNSSMFGKYTVIAENSMGIEKIFIDVVKRVSPSMPQNLESTIRTDTKVILQWQSGFNGGFEQKFQIKYRLLDKDKWKYLKGVVSDKGDTRYNLKVVSDLLPGSQYVFAVYAVNPFGNSSALYTNSSTLNKANFPDSETMYGAGVALLVIGLLMIIAAICISVLIIRKYRPVLGTKNKNKKSSEEAYCNLGDNREKPNVYDDCKETQNVPASEDKNGESNEAYLELDDNRENPHVYDVCIEKTNESARREQLYENASFKQ